MAQNPEKKRQKQQKNQRNTYFISDLANFPSTLKKRRMEIRRLFDIPYYQKAKYPQSPAVSGKHISDRVDSYSTDQLIEKMNQVSLGLLQIGMKPGDKIAVISYNNRPEWNILDLGMQQIGVINVPVYPTISPSDYEFIFNDAQVKYCFVGHGDLLDKVRKAQPKIPSLRGIFTFDPVSNEKDANGSEVNHWETIFASGDLSAVEEIKKGIQPEDIATIIYTSGTTGNPKGVVLTHNNIASNVRSVLPLIPASPGDIGLSFLPLCHIFERTVTYSYMAKGIQIFYAKSIDALAESLQEVRPHFFTTVPRLLEKVYEKMVTNIRKESAFKQKVFFWAESLTEHYSYDFKPSGLEALKWKIADAMVFKKVRQRLGGRLKGIVTGAAACPRKMAQFFSAMGVPVREGYGLTETSPAISIARFEPGQALLGTVGPILDGVEVKIELDANYGPEAGEILVKGPNVMKGYYNQPEKTAEVFTADGWFRTGDVGRLVKNSKGVTLLQITDRKKELLKTSGGKYVAPAPLESSLKEDFLIEQAMVVGDNKKFVSALIVPAPEPLKNWCERHDIPFQSVEKAIQHQAVIAKFQEIIDELNPQFGKVEQIKKFALVPETWGVETGELTPTMKLKRRVILERYQKTIDDLYKGEE